MANQPQGRYIVLEGPPGVGKTTQLKLLAKSLRVEGYIVKVFYRAAKTQDLTTKAIRKVIKDSSTPAETRAEAILFSSINNQIFGFINNARNNGVICLADYSFLSTLINQFYGRTEKLDFTKLNDILKHSKFSVFPDTTIVLDAPADILKRRTSTNKSENNKPVNLKHLNELRAGYLIEAKARHYPVITAIEESNIVHQKIVKLLHGGHTAVSEKKMVVSESDNKNTKTFINSSDDKAINNLDNPYAINQFTIENASELLITKIKCGRLNTCLQIQNSPDLENTNSKLSRQLYIPKKLDIATLKSYQVSMTKILGFYSEIFNALFNHLSINTEVPKPEQNQAWEDSIKVRARVIASSVLPMATLSTLNIFASKKSYESLTMNLLADDLPEAISSGRNLLAQSRYKAGSSPDKSDKLEYSGATISYKSAIKKTLSNHANEYLPSSYNQFSDPVMLVDVWPRNELDIVADILYEYSSSPLTTLRQDISDWPYKQKELVYNSYMGNRISRFQVPGRAVEKLRYSFDILCDYNVFKELKQRRFLDDLQWQPLTPRYGYDIPLLIEKAGVAEQYIECFDLSLELYSLLQSIGLQNEAQYATLMGHKMRFKLTFNGREAFHLLESCSNLALDNLEVNKVVGQMYEQILSVHPLTGEAIKFVNPS